MTLEEWLSDPWNVVLPGLALGSLVVYILEVTA